MNTNGASVWVVMGSSQLVCPVAPGAGSVSITPSGAPLTFIFPKHTFVTGLLVLPLPSGAFASYEAQLAQLSVQVIDETSQPLITDTRGTMLGTTNAPPAAPLLLLFGKSFRPYRLQRPVSNQDQWLFTIQNADTARAQTLAGIYLYFDAQGESS